MERKDESPAGDSMKITWIVRFWRWSTWRQLTIIHANRMFQNSLSHTSSPISSVLPLNTRVFVRYLDCFVGRAFYKWFVCFRATAEVALQKGLRGRVALSNTTWEGWWVWVRKSKRQEVAFLTGRTPRSPMFYTTIISSINLPSRFRRRKRIRAVYWRV